MKKKIIIPITLSLLLFSINSYAQETKETPDKSASPQKEDVEWERPFNFFAAAGASYMFGNHYTVVVSPIDNTVQFEKTFPILTRFSLGLVWNPIPEKGEDYIKNFIKKKNLTMRLKRQGNI